MTLPIPSFLTENVPLAPFTTLGIGGPARYLGQATNEDQVLEAVEFASAGGHPLFILGGGSNILVSDSGFAGLVIRMSSRGITPLADEVGIITVQAGEEWDPFVRWCVDRNLAGIECLSGIPGTVGGTPVQNVGAYGQEVREVVLSVRVLDLHLHETRELSNAECRFAYRASIFNSLEPDRYIVLSVTFALRRGGRARVQYADLQRHFGDNAAPLLSDVREAVLRIRAGKAMVLTPGDPDSKSAGSFFKNPVVDEPAVQQVGESARRHGVLAKGETVPSFVAAEGKLKLPAAWLIEHAGFPKGYIRGAVGISSKHSLALINRGGATAADVLDLVRDIQGKVLALFGIELVPEPVFVGF